jgi:hypothetical protein
MAVELHVYTFSDESTQLVAVRASPIVISIVIGQYSPHSYPPLHKDMNQPQAKNVISLMPIAVGLQVLVLKSSRVGNSRWVRGPHEVQVLLAIGKQKPLVSKKCWNAIIYANLHLSDAKH